MKKMIFYFLLLGLNISLARDIDREIRCKDFDLINILKNEKDEKFKSEVSYAFLNLDAEVRSKCLQNGELKFNLKSCYKQCFNLFIAGSNRDKCSTYCDNFDTGTSYYESAFGSALYATAPKNAAPPKPAPVMRQDCDGSVVNTSRGLILDKKIPVVQDSALLNNGVSK